MPLLDPRDPRPIHFVGIAGAGMSALAELFARRGAAITGCDANPGAAADLERLGVRVTSHDPAHVTGARALVVTSAMPQTHPEIVRARELGVPVIRRAEALGEVTAGRELIGIAGTHGKTTTTVMTATALTGGGLEPTALAGGRVSLWEGNLLAGNDALFVVEADEYDRSFLALSPTVAVVTSIEADHLDIYRDLADIRTAFAQFVSGARAVVLCGDDRGADTLHTPATAEILRYGMSSDDARVRAVGLELGPNGSVFELTFDDERLGEVRLAVPGMHNVLNALAALSAGIAVGADVPGMVRGLEAYRGVERRFQRLGEAAGVAVVDDYAHNPGKVRAVLATARVAFPERRLVVAFQPHLFTRTRDFAQEFGQALAVADVILLADVYPAREQPIPGVSSALVRRAVEGYGTDVAWCGPRAELARALAARVLPGDVVLTVGAGDITATGPELLALLRERAT